MKKILPAIFLLTIFFSTFLSNVSAQNVNFSITAAGSWSTDISNPSKNDTNKYSGINWNYSNRGNHTMWFAITDQSFLVVAKSLFSGKKTDVLLTSGLDENESAYLKAKRENSGDPTTIVSGIWSA